MLRMFLVLLACCCASMAIAGGATVNINAATVEKIAMLPGIGPVKAKAIAEYRAMHGSFSNMEALLKVKGIGPATLESIRKHIVFSPPPARYVNDPAAAPAGPGP